MKARASATVGLAAGLGGGVLRRGGWNKQKQAGKRQQGRNDDADCEFHGTETIEHLADVL